MLTNILKTTLQHFYRERLYSLINISGMALSFCCFLILFLYLKNELSVDQHFINHERIYRIVADADVGAQHTSNAKVGSAVGPLLAKDYEQFSTFVRMAPIAEEGDLLVLTENFSRQYSQGVYSADNSVFDIFQLGIVAGDPATALTEPRSMAISESMARLYFGDEDPIGQSIGIQLLTNTFTVKLVFADLPENTSLKFDMLLSYRNRPLAEADEDNFEQGIVQFRDYTYFLLPQNYAVSDFANISESFFHRYVSAGAQQMFPGQKTHLRLKLQALDEIYFAEPLQEDIGKGSRFMVAALSILAIFILGVASVNYMTLSTARFARRARESGIRRTFGASTRAIVLQFLAEGMLYSLIAFLIAASVTEVLLSTALDKLYLGINLSLFVSGQSVVWQVLVIALALGALSGSYPGYYFSTVKPVDIFRPLLRVQKFGFSMRSLLVGLQLLVSLCVISSALLMFEQIDYLNSKPLGFNKDNKLDIHVNIVANSSTFRATLNELRSHPGVRNVTMTDKAQGSQAYSQPFLVKNSQGEEIGFQSFSYFVDENYLDTFAIPLLQGRNFVGDDLSSESVTVKPMLVNEALVRAAGWEQPIGQLINKPTEDEVGEVVGVIADFNYSSLHQKIKPFALDRFYENYRWQRDFILDIEPGQLAAVLTHARGVMQKFSPETPFEYTFLDQTLKTLYGKETRQLQLVTAGALVCIVISLLGILGMIAFTLDQSTREIALRRVLGGTMTRIIAVKFKGLFLLIALASMLSSLLVIYELGIWLESFAYRAPLNPMLFVLAALLVCALVVLALVLQSSKVVRARPVQALRYE